MGTRGTGKGKEIAGSLNGWVFVCCMGLQSRRLSCVCCMGLQSGRLSCVCSMGMITVLLGVSSRFRWLRNSSKGRPRTQATQATKRIVKLTRFSPPASAATPLVDVTVDVAVDVVTVDVAVDVVTVDVAVLDLVAVDVVVDVVEDVRVEVSVRLVKAALLS